MSDYLQADASTISGRSSIECAYGIRRDKFSFESHCDYVEIFFNDDILMECYFRRGKGGYRFIQHFIAVMIKRNYSWLIDLRNSWECSFHETDSGERNEYKWNYNILIEWEYENTVDYGNFMLVRPIPRGGIVTRNIFTSQISSSSRMKLSLFDSHRLKLKVIKFRLPFDRERGVLTIAEEGRLWSS